MRDFKPLRFFGVNPRSTFVKSVKIMGPIVAQNLASWKLDKAGRWTLDTIFYEKRHKRFGNVASNFAARRQAASSMRFEVRRLTRAQPDLRWRFATIISDQFNFNDRSTVVPLERIKRTLGQLAQRTGVDGWLGGVEAQSMDKSFAHVGRDILGHGHFLIWTRDHAFDFNALEQELAASSRLRCASGAPTVVLTGADTDAASPRDKLRWVEEHVWYIWKAPVYAKNINFRRERPRAYGCSTSPQLATRLIEILSRLRMDELVMGFGEGKRMADSVRMSIRNAAAPHESQAFDDEIEAFWAFARRRNSKERYRPVVVERWKNGKRTAPYSRGPYRKGGGAPALTAR